MLPMNLPRLKRLGLSMAFVRWLLSLSRPAEHGVQGSTTGPSRKRVRLYGGSWLEESWPARQRRFWDVHGSCGEMHRKRSMVFIISAGWDIASPASGDMGRGPGVEVSGRAAVWKPTLHSVDGWVVNIKLLKLLDSVPIGISISEWSVLLLGSIWSGKLWLMSPGRVMALIWEIGCCSWEIEPSGVSLEVKGIWSNWSVVQADCDILIGLLCVTRCYSRGYQNTITSREYGRRGESGVTLGKVQILMWVRTFIYIVLKEDSRLVKRLLILLKHSWCMMVFVSMNRGELRGRQRTGSY